MNHSFFSFPSGTELFQFQYTVNTYYGKLQSVEDDQFHRLRVLYDYSSVTGLVNPDGHKSEISINMAAGGSGMLQHFNTPDNFSA